MKRNILVCYDTPSTKRRTKISDLLSKYGTRVNYSVFELLINDTKLKSLEAKLLSLLKPKEDSLRIYHICENCLYKSKSLCDDKQPFLPSESLIL
ncbi:CRISPR-associated endonuclease Cas2 [Wolinella succinogenes]|uniref:CRISPR-associated endonuclease Cas2 n=1 Tax=Wolinella succinogenes TaxID=844 RepID=UPI003C6FCF8A